MDVLAIFAGDPRVQLNFTVDGGSWFSGRLGERLRAAGAVSVSWEAAVAQRFDLALAASDNGDLHRLHAPVVLVPHGVGYQRYAADEPGAVSGLRVSTLIREGRVVPSAIVVSHSNQLEVIRRLAPLLLPRAVVAGDPCFDRIRASAHWRDRYRAALGATGKRLVVLCSTWGLHSLYGKDPTLPAVLLGGLDVDSHRVALVLHPNVWEEHGQLQIETWVRPAIEGGLVMVPPEEGWRAALVAADVVISDHGSLTTYAVGAGVPVLLAEDGGPEVVPGSAIDRLRQRLPRLRPDLPLGDQLAAAAPLGSETVDGLFAGPGRSLEALRSLVYGHLRLPPPSHTAAARPVPVPDLCIPLPTTYSVWAEVESSGNGRATAVLRRFPAAVYDEDRERARHLAVDETELDPGWVERASVVWSDDVKASVGEAEAWASATLARWPAARVAATALGGGRSLALVRGGPALVLSGEASPSLVGSALRCFLVGGVWAVDLRELTIVAGGVRTIVHVHAG